MATEPVCRSAFLLSLSFNIFFSLAGLAVVAPVSRIQSPFRRLMELRSISRPTEESRWKRLSVAGGQTNQALVGRLDNIAPPLLAMANFHYFVVQRPNRSTINSQHPLWTGIRRDSIRNERTGGWTQRGDFSHPRSPTPLKAFSEDFKTFQTGVEDLPTSSCSRNSKRNSRSL